MDVRIYAVCGDTLSKGRVAGLFRSAGWHVGKCGWTEYEVRCPWAELVIEGEKEVLIHGHVSGDPERAEHFLGLLRSSGMPFQLEFYDLNGKLFREEKQSGS